MSDYNNLTFTNYVNVAKDGEIRNSAAGNDYGLCTVAVNVEKDKDSPPMWVTIMGFKEMAQTVGNIRKGDKIQVTGKLSRKKWTDKDGLERDGWTIFADHIGGDISKPAFAGGDLTEEDVPF